MLTELQRATPQHNTTRRVPIRATVFDRQGGLAEDFILNYRRYGDLKTPFLPDGGLLETPALYARHLCLHRVREAILIQPTAMAEQPRTWSYLSLNDSQHAPQQSGFGHQERSQPSTTASLLSSTTPASAAAIGVLKSEQREIDT
jgi:hypothetical protein